MVSAITPATGSFERTDLYQIYNVVQNTLMSYPKELIISLLRDVFSQDSYYHYVGDEYGFPKVKDLTDQPLNIGFADDDATRLFIGEAFRFDAVFYPALLVRMNSAKSIPISISRNKYTVEYEKTILFDGYGNSREIFKPAYYDLAGAYEGTIQIDILCRDILSRDNLISILMLLFTDIKYEAMRKAGVLVKPPSLSGVSETEDRTQEKLYKASINLEIRTEWRRLIPISNLLEQINFCIDFQNPYSKITSPNLEINTNISILDQFTNL